MFFFEWTLLLLTWTSLDSFTGLGVARVAEGKLRTLMDTREVLAIAGECPAYTNGRFAEARTCREIGLASPPLTAAESVS